jgi:hypothetical protein
MNKRRLLKLADLLEADARNRRGIKFDLNVVGYVNNIPEDKIVKLDCGTSACAMGLAAMSGAFNREGLSYRVTTGWLNNVATTFKGRKVQYDTAAMRLFDISRRDADFLFTSGQYPTEQKGAKGERYVAKRIRDFVAGKVAAP